MANFVPELYQQILMDAGQQSDDGKWRIGDIAAELLRLMTYKDDNGKETIIHRITEEPMTKDEFWRGVGTYCGKSGGTVRDCWRISTNVPITIRGEYDMLSRSHFRVMIPYYETVGELRDLCMQALEWGDEYGGRIISVEALTRKLHKDNGEPPAWVTWLKRAMGNLTKIRDHQETPPDVAGWAGEVIDGRPEND